jgi:outer membrane protein
MKNLSLFLCVGCALAAPAMAATVAATATTPMAAASKAVKNTNMPAKDVKIRKKVSKKPSNVVLDAPAVVSTDVAAVETKEPLAAPKGPVSTLADALASAYVNNPGLLQKRQELMYKHETIAQKKADYLPSVTSEIGLKGNKSLTSGTAKAQSSSYTSSSRNSSRTGSITIEQNLFAGGSTMAAVLSADQTIRGLWADLLSNEQKTFSEVIKAYLDLISKTSRVDVLKANHAALKKAYETAFEKHSIGEEPLTQVAIAESKLAGAEAELRTEEANVIGAKATLAALIGTEVINIAKPDAPTNLPQTLETSISMATDNNPAVIKAQFDHKAAEADIDEVEGKYYLPRVDLKARSQRDESSARNLYAGGAGDVRYSNNVTDHSVGVYMSYNLYSGGKYSSKKRELHDTAVSKRIAIEAAKTEITGAVKSTFESYNAAKTNIDNYKKQVKAAEVALEATRQEMEVGTKVLLDVLNAQAELVKAQLGFIDAEKNLFQSAYQMVSLLGGLHAKAMKLTVNYFDPVAHYDNISVGF